VDGKKKSAVASPAAAVVKVQEDSQSSNSDIQGDISEGNNKGKAQDSERLQFPRIRMQSPESTRKLVDMDMKRLEVQDEIKEVDVKRNPDGSICEDCN
jgi:hypothetical protein